MAGLPEILAPGLKVILCGTAVGEASAKRGHYYAGPRNDFWRLLHESGLTPERLEPAHDQELPRHGIGLMDLAPGVTQSHDRGLRLDLPHLMTVLERYRPHVLAFTSLHGAQEVAKQLHEPRAVLGFQPWSVGGIRVFVLPSPSGANQRRDYQGRPTRLDWWKELANDLHAA